MNEPSPSVSSMAASATGRQPRSALVWLLLVGYLVAAKLVLDTFLPHAFADPAQAAFFGWAPLGAMAVLGLVGVLLAERTGFAAAWAEPSPLRRQVLVPLVVGVAFGALQVAIDLASGFTKLVAARHGLPQQYTDFPSMLVVFTAAPIIVEVVYRLFVVPLLLWLVSNLLLQGRAQAPVFGVLAVLSSAFEPFTQLPDLQAMPAGVGMLVGVEYFALNLTQAAFFRRRGFLAAILVRVGFYVVWHVLYVH